MWRDTCKGALVLTLKIHRSRMDLHAGALLDDGKWREGSSSGEQQRTERTSAIVAARADCRAGSATYHSAIDKGHAGAENDNPAAVGRRRHTARAGENCSFVALRLDDHGHGVRRPATR